MKLDWSDLAGVVLEPAERHEDRRGSFEKLFDGSRSLPITATQLCTSFNHVRGTVRGLHVQLAPHPEHKALWCSSGELFDVLVDTRSDQPTFGSWATIHLSATAPQLLRVPPGVAHGYQTLADRTTVNYLIEGAHHPGSARTIRWNDATLAIEWPLPVTEISDSDRDGLPWPLF